MGDVVFVCWCILPAAASPSHALHKAAEDHPSSTAMMSWDCPTLSYQGCLCCDHIDANVYWTEAFLMVSAQFSAASPCSSFHFRIYTVVTDLRLLKKETCLFFWGPLTCQFCVLSVSIFIDGPRTAEGTVPVIGTLSGCTSGRRWWFGVMLGWKLSLFTLGGRLHEQVGDTRVLK